MSKIGDLIIAAEEGLNNDQRLRDFYQKWKKYCEDIENESQWWEDMDKDQDYIKQHEPGGDS